MRPLSLGAILAGGFILGSAANDLVEVEALRLHPSPTPTPAIYGSTYGSLKVATEIQLDLVRNGAPMTITYWIDHDR